MYPDLSYLFHDLIGTAPDNGLSVFKTFGFFLALAFLASAYFYARELKRKAQEGLFTPIPETIIEGKPASIWDIASNVLLGLILAGKGWYAAEHFDVFRRDPASIILSTKINWTAGVLGAIALGVLAWWDARRRALPEPVEKTINVWPHQRISELTVTAAICGIFGAKMFDIFDNWESFTQDPIGTLTSGGGLAFFGGLICGFIGVVWYQYTKKMPFLHSVDAFSPCIVAGYGVGRIGCQLSGDGDWGIVNNAPKPGWMSFLPDWTWAYQYPHNILNTTNTDPVPSVPIEGCTYDYCMQLSQPVYPTPFYEILMMLVIFGIIWSLRKKIKAPGMLFFIYLIFSGAERFTIEKIRVNVKHDWLGMQITQAEMISICMMLIGIAGSIWAWRRHQSKPV